MTSTGWCVIEDFKVISYGKINTSPKDFTTEDERINYIVDKIESVMDNITFVGIENQFISNRTSTIMVLRKLLGATMRMITQKGICVEYLAPTSVKKIITGNGRAGKEKVAKYIQDNYIDIGEYSDKAGNNKTSDIYDAISIAVAVKQMFGGNYDKSR
ncbi:Holliday junction resolvase [Peptostreptococcus anaerobius]|uniref:Holliday junction resolvase n=2 Tax=Peptostreptococcaceae TaxID=186804 RepID=A0A379CIE7_9FIRM|nr:crossover junction endodeoxyribonuclease RuvC [Peptostreptococcus anaerobius]SUB62130.1 Holliday junction resolvase [Peptostreptococcus anaerobius]